jgi:hypothetical protein
MAHPCLTWTSRLPGCTSATVEPSTGPFLATIRSEQFGQHCGRG